MSHISLLDLSKLIRHTLEQQLESTYWVVAEIGELRLHQRGHCYLELIEKQNDVLVTKQRATIWSTAYKSISYNFEQVTGQHLAPGINILCQVQVQYHELYGLSLNIREIDPNFTLGERARKRAEIVQRLLQEGLYDMNRQHELATAPQRIAVITSSTAAGWGDFLHQLLMNPFRYRFDLELFEAVMQGENAHQSICLALESVVAARLPFDAVVIIRGGGARIDLDCFDHYELAAAIARHGLPVLTGIGHDRDETIADLVAHTRLKTPTAVAEFLVNRLHAFASKAETLANNIFAYASQYNANQYQHLQQLQHKIQTATKNMLALRQQKLQQMGAQIRAHTRHRIRFGREQLYNLQRLLDKSAVNALCQESAKLNQIALTLHLQDPERLLHKGYTITYLDGKPLHKAG
ncbi:MAG: exodeoxyribonuclease VII large subunit, partial [Bacteroidetes bacterium]|nr:exodeoxyribonuclease VII large subunit [Bacteroidota bacterium]